ncbi:hypothetical protein B9Y60_06950 [Stenotrophomonas maltophilia]|uniref:hypothetical protein n=1 Tax=Stenotrophomonas maltophilia TaxID=40324 RepID=UPI000C26BAC1|nr:hypothetical protein [Stenotrophomonas maltophilia]PJL54997.1 hypothetical protein B9Y73_06950 [Stenotrophomonas maltophilia]PJL56640.1 hypothetical protein B9Y60_06950 [Stenotrophomonas maltophilia]
MTDTFGRFGATPIGPMLAARDGGLTLATTGATAPASHARSDFSLDAGTVGVEFAVWGDDPVAAIVGFATAASAMSKALGAELTSIGWDLGSGRLLQAGGAIETDLPAVGHGDIVGLQVVFSIPRQLRLYLNGAQILVRELQLSGPLHFAASLGASKAGGLCLAMNAGQWGPRCEAAASGWRLPPATVNEATPTRLADVDWLAAPGDSPANARYEGLVAEGVSLIQELAFWPWGGDSVSQSAAAECVVADADGILDAMAGTGATGRSVQILLAPENGMRADAVPAFRCAIEQIEINDDGTKTLHLRDAHDYLDETINRGVFLPNVPSLAWKPQPVVIGAVASIPAMGANSDATSMFVADSRVYIDAVMDRGDLMEDGTYSEAPDGQQLLLKSPPVTPVVVDASSIGAGMMPARLQQAVGEVMARLGREAWSASDCTAIDQVTGYMGIGYYAGTAITGRAVLNALLPSYGAGCYQDPSGVLRFVRVTAPETYAGAFAFDLSEDDLSADLVMVPDDAPNLTRRMAYRPNGQALGASDLVTDVVDVPQSRRDELTGLYRGQVYGAGPLHAHYQRAEAADPVISLFWHAADAQQEIERVLGMYQVQRHFYQLAVRGDQDLAPLPGQIGRLTYGRYGLEDGKLVLVRRVERNPATGDVVLTVWG